MVKFGTMVRTWEFLPKPNLKKNRLRGKLFLGKFIQKITKFGDLGAVSTHFKNDSG